LVNEGAEPVLESPLFWSRRQSAGDLSEARAFGISSHGGQDRGQVVFRDAVWHGVHTFEGKFYLPKNLF
jgi:hypothetical protein